MHERAYFFPTNFLFLHRTYDHPPIPLPPPILAAFVMPLYQVAVEVRECGASREETVEADVDAMEGALREAVQAALGLGVGSWLYERYDSAFEEWADMDNEHIDDTTEVRLRVTERAQPQDNEHNLDSLFHNLANVEDKLHHLTSKLNGDSETTPTVTDKKSHMIERCNASCPFSYPELEDDVESNATRTDPCSPHGKALLSPSAADHLGVTSPQSCTSPSSADKIAEYDLGSHVITAEEAYRRFFRVEGAPQCFFVDVRGKHEAEATGTIRGAIRTNKAFLEWHTDPCNPLFTPALLANLPLILYATGNVTEGARPAHAAYTLLHMGISHIYVLKEGILKWKALGYPTSTETGVFYPQVCPVVKLTHTVADMVTEARKITKFVTVKEAEELIGVEGIIFVDVRSTEEIKATGVVVGAAIGTRELVEWYSDPQSKSHHKLFNPLLASGKKIILYGGGQFGGGRPILVLATLKKILPYHSNVSVLEGGFAAWQEAGLPCEAVESFVPREDLLPGGLGIASVATFLPRKILSPDSEISSLGSSSLGPQ